MDELNSKFLSKDPTVISLLISKLVDKIEEEYKSEKVYSEQFSFLQSKCVGSENQINEIAAEGILKLLKRGILDVNNLLEEFISLIPSNKISRGVVKVICGVLYYQFSKSNKNSQHNKFNMFLLQHPFITLLINNSECFPYIYRELRFASTIEKNSSWNMWNYPFYQYCFCNPINKKPMFYKMKLWINLLSSGQDDELVVKLITWMPFDPTSSLLVSTELLNELSNMSHRSKIETEVILLLQVSALYKLVSKGHDPRDTVLAIKYLLNEMDQINCINPILLILVKAVTRALSSHTLDILRLCELLIDQPNINYFILVCLKASLLLWIGNPSSLSDQIFSKASELYILVDNLLKKGRTHISNSKEIYEKYQEIILSNQELCIAFDLMIICESMETKESISKFLRELDNLSIHFIRKLIHLVYGLFICDVNNTNITLGAFKILCASTDNLKKFSHSVLTLTLYGLSKTSNPKIHFALFNYLPKLASISENYLKVVTTLRVLYSSSDFVLKTFGLKLMYDLWKMDNNAYQFLEEMLTDEEPIKHKWEFYINKAYVIKQICGLNSKVYGEEMVAHLSRILNNCSEGEGELASSIAIDAISILCSEGIIDVKTTWLTLAPKYLTDKRTKTVKSMCGLASAIFNLMHPEHHKDLQKEVTCKIWDYVNCPDNEVKNAALNALAGFGLENISLHFPEQYRMEASMSKSDITPQVVTGGCWINFLKDQTNLTVVGDFLIYMIKKEVEEYPKYVYHITSKREPINYALLPSHSLVRGIVEYCTSQTKKWNGLYKHVFIECMRILSQEYSKPLPPYNWSFLQELCYEPELKIYCIIIAAHQVMISGTARRFIENYIEALTKDFENIDEVLLIYRNLKFLTNSIQPMLFEAFFNRTLNYAQYLMTEKSNKDFLISLIEAIKDTLANPSVQNISKKGLISIIDSKLASFNESDEIFTIFVDCITCYPTDFLRTVTTLPKSFEMTNESFRKAVRIRCKLAMSSSNKLKWLDDLIDINAVSTSENYVLEEFLQIFKLHHNPIDCIQWTKDLIGRIEAAVADNNVPSYKIFLIEVLVIAIVAFSGFHIFSNSKLDITQYLNLLPNASATLLEIKEWSNDSSRIMECFYFLNLNKGKSIPQTYQNAFGQALQALRHHPEFKKGNKWMKYLNADIHLKNIR